MSPLTLEKIRKMFALSLKGTFMQIEKALINMIAYKFQKYP